MTRTTSKKKVVETPQIIFDPLSQEQINLGIEWNERSDEYTQALLNRDKNPNPDTGLKVRQAKERFRSIDNALKSSCENNEDKIHRAKVAGLVRNKVVTRYG